jgi:hypothetical protein
VKEKETKVKGEKKELGSSKQGTRLKFFVRNIKANVKWEV